MHDAFLKSVFADRCMAEILIRRHAPEWATEIDFSTLRVESTGLVSKKTLQRRHPDMIWSADTVKGGRVLFLLEFQRTVERLMALRTTTYTALTLEGIAAGADFGPGDPLPEFVYLVLYHGGRPDCGRSRRPWRCLESPVCSLLSLRRRIWYISRYIPMALPSTRKATLDARRAVPARGGSGRW